MGKGDKQRPTLIDDGTFKENWCRTWGHKMRETHEVCRNCGLTAQEIYETEHSAVVPARRSRRRVRAR